MTSIQRFITTWSFDDYINTLNQSHISEASYIVTGNIYPKFDDSNSDKWSFEADILKNDEFKKNRDQASSIHNSLKHIVCVDDVMFGSFEGTDFVYDPKEVAEKAISFADKYGFQGVCVNFRKGVLKIKEPVVKFFEEIQNKRPDMTKVIKMAYHFSDYKELNFNEHKVPVDYFISEHYFMDGVTSYPTIPSYLKRSDSNNYQSLISYIGNDLGKKKGYQEAYDRLVFLNLKYSKEKNILMLFDNYESIYDKLNFFNQTIGGLNVNSHFYKGFTKLSERPC
ncbi:hypothetical protein BB560_001902 [Smittium megazygosporum]|uniref:Uncharacterized protein n=1 Tax=Smittium megazygosporum TaxID=133381 RepID=A0A2T9ZG89_9FUNG|nr:hypothetical protein BB560_001902 [Smittium megazygosporum]